MSRRFFCQSSLVLGGLVGLQPTLVLPAFAQASGNRTHGHSLTGSLKYPKDFQNFDYVNLEAPQQGTVRLRADGGFDSFNPFILKGDAVNVTPWIYETLMLSSLDEGSAHYGLLAEWMEYPEDNSAVTFKLRETARWHDGKPVTPEDIIFSFERLTGEGASPFWRFYYGNIEAVEAVDAQTVRFKFDEKGNRELPHIVGQMPILPKHWWQDKDFAASSLERPLGSGPYKIGAFEANRYVTFERVQDYWGNDLPVRKGTMNFQQLRFEYFRDQDVAHEAFKAGKIDFVEENSAKRWATGYDFNDVKSGDVIKEEVTLEGTKAVQFFAFNLRKSRFQDKRVRQALSLAFDFEWTNATIYFNQYARPRSYAQGAQDLMPQGKPTGQELAFLEELRDQVPPEVFGEPYEPAKTDASGRNRQNMRQAVELLQQAGWQMRDNKLVNADGEVFKVEFLSAQDAQKRVVAPYLKNLERLGIQTNMRFVDSSQYLKRAQEFDFDFVIYGLQNSDSPGNEQRDYWSSAVADQPGGRNLAGVKDPAVDALIEKIVFAKDREALTAAFKALDRVLTWNYYTVLQLYTPFDRIAYRKTLGHPDPLPERSIGFPTVWWQK
jgi:microcin C transport system substrate-binding protein